MELRDTSRHAGWFRRRGSRLVIAGVAMTLALALLAGCGMGSRAAQGVLSGVLDRATGGGVKLEDGGITITGDDGETFGLSWEGGSVPAGFPPIVPDAWEIVGSLEFSSDGRKAWSATIGAEGSADRNVQMFKQGLAAQGFQVKEVDELPEDADTDGIDVMEVFNVVAFEGAHGGKKFGGHAIFMEPSEDNEGEVLLIQLTVGEEE